MRFHIHKWVWVLDGEKDTYTGYPRPSARTCLKCQKVMVRIQTGYISDKWVEPTYLSLNDECRHKLDAIRKAKGE